jgi:hypothetical protein
MEQTGSKSGNHWLETTSVITFRRNAK